jgi:hypothetical protein
VAAERTSRHALGRSEHVAVGVGLLAVGRADHLLTSERPTGSVTRTSLLVSRDEMPFGAGRSATPEHPRPHARGSPSGAAPPYGSERGGRPPEKHATLVMR